jgi:serine protease Do
MERLKVLLAVCLLAELGWLLRPKPSPDWTAVREAVVGFEIRYPAVEVTMAADGSPVLTQRVEGWGGTGFLVSPDGYAITAAHVVTTPPDATISVSFYGAPGVTMTPIVVYVNPTLDIALVKLTLPAAFPYLKLGSGEKTRVGDELFAVGHPLGLKWSVFSTILSAKRFTQGRRVDAAMSAVEQYVFQLSHPLQYGISGGPVVDKRGRVVCMAHAALVASKGAQMNYCVPVEEIKWVLETQGVGGK